MAIKKKTQRQLDIEAEQERTHGRWLCRGFTIANASTEAFMRATAETWKPLIIPQSVTICRQPGNLTTYCIFSTTRPVGGFRTANIGRPDDRQWDPDPNIGFDGFLGGPGYKAAAIPAFMAEDLGILTEQEVNEFEMAAPQVQRGALTEPVVEGERQRVTEHKARMKRMKQSDDEEYKRKLKQDVVESTNATLGSIIAGAKWIVYSANDGAKWIFSQAGKALGFASGQVVNAASWLGGKAFGFAISQLGPVGIGVILVGGYFAAARILPKTPVGKLVKSKL